MKFFTLAPVLVILRQEAHILCIPGLICVTDYAELFKSYQDNIKLIFFNMRMKKLDHNVTFKEWFRFFIHKCICTNACLNVYMYSV
jgi:hypothetical protein